MTARRPWYKRYPSDFRAATAGLPYNVKGTYSHVLDLIYDHNGPIDDKASDIARALGCDRHTWRDHRAALIKAGKLFVEGGKLMNGRAARELGEIPHPEADEWGNSPDSESSEKPNDSGAAERETLANAESGKSPREKKPRRAKKANGYTDLPQCTLARARASDTRSQIQTPGAPFGKGGATPSQNSTREKRSHGRRHKATNLENWAKAVELRRRWKDHGGGDGGTEDSGELP